MNTLSLKKVFDEVQFDFNDQVYIYQVESIHLFKLYEVYKKSMDSAPIIRPFGSWLHGEDIQVTRDTISEARNDKRIDFGVRER